MSTHAVSCVQHGMDEFRSFLRSTYKLAEHRPRIQKNNRRHIFLESDNDCFRACKIGALWI